MYKSMMEDLKKTYQPLVELNEINKQVWESLFKQSSEYSRELLSNSLSQVKTLAASKDMFSLLDNQAVFVKNLDASLVSLAQKQTSTLLEAREASTKVMDELADTYNSALKNWGNQFKS